GGGGFPSIFVQAFKNATANPFDAENGNTANPSTTNQVGSVTPASSGELIVTHLGWGTTGQTASIDSGFTITDQIDLVSGQHYGGALAYKIKTDAAAENPTWTVTTAVQLTARIAAFIGSSIALIAGGGHKFLGEVQSTGISAILNSSIGLN